LCRSLLQSVLFRSIGVTITIVDGLTIGDEVAFEVESN